MRLLLTLIYSLCSMSHAFAQIATDGSLGIATQLQGPNYDISAHLGQQQGNNLFHSFHTFNIHSGETATFNGDNSILNIFSRITDGNPSYINGEISSAIPNSSLYLINTSGFLFGAQASLDIPGTFHISTGTSLTFDDNTQWSAFKTQHSTLTSASPAAFGFLDQNTQPAATVSLQGSQLILSNQQSFSIRAGHIVISDGAKISVPDGNIQLITNTQAAEVPINISQTLPNVQGGTLLIQDNPENQSDNANIDVSGLVGSGYINAQADNIIIRGATLYADNKGPDFSLRNQASGINLTAQKLIMDKGARITAEALHTGDAGEIQITATDISLQDGAQIITATRGAGNAGNMILNASKSITLTDINTGLFSNSISSGDAGHISIKTPHLKVKLNSIIRTSAIDSDHNDSIGNAGDVSIQVEQLNLEQKSQISLSAGSFEHLTGTGSVGDLTITAEKAVIISDSALTSNQFTNGQPGIIDLQTPTLLMEQNATAQAATAGTQQAGQVRIKASNIFLTGKSFVNVETIGSGSAGVIEAQNIDRLVLLNSILTARSAGVEEAAVGDIEINLSDGSLHSVNDTLGNLNGNFTLHSTGQKPVSAPQIQVAPAQTVALRRTCAKRTDLPQNKILQDLTLRKARYLKQVHIGRDLIAQGQLQQALQAYKTGFIFAKPDTKTGLYTDIYIKPDANIEQSFDEFLQLLLAYPTSEHLNLATTVIENHNAINLQAYFDDDCLKKTTGLKNFSENTAIIYPILLSNSFNVIVKTADNIQHYTLSQQPEFVHAEINTLLASMPSELNPNSKLNRDSLAILYDLIFTPLDALLKNNNIDTLVIVSNSTIQGIPFAALFDGKKYLIEKYALATVLGLNLLNEQPSNILQQPSIFYGGLSQSEYHNKTLQYVDKIKNELIQLYSNIFALTGTNFMFMQLEQSLLQAQYSILHLDSHAKFNNALDSYIETYDSRITLNQLEQLVMRKTLQNQPIELMILGACSTAKGNKNAILGLSGIALKAGTSSTIATLWDVNDKFSYQLLTEFHKNLLRTTNKAKALQKAQLKMLNGESLFNKNKRNKPELWSPFILMGYWQ